MKISILVIPLAITACALIGCGDGGYSDRVVLADFHFSRNDADSLAGRRIDLLVDVHRLAVGWGNLEEQGIWTVGPESIAEFYVLGDSLILDLVATTSRQLVDAQQDVNIFFNGVHLARLPFETAWYPHHVSVAIPAGAVREDWNELKLVPRETGWPGQDEDLGIYVQRIRITGLLDRPTRARLDATAVLTVDATDYALQPGPADQHRRQSEGRPDVLVILPDAARADHFGCYGYDRDTTPFIDSLATAGLVYEDVTAAAPYTLNSATTILTGRNWCDHGVVDYGDALGPELPTMAEILSSSGVHTLGVSENPNVSRAAGNDRGFDEFYECWGEGGKATETAEDVVDRVLGSFPGERPAFGYIHLLPPHDPYHPPARHDSFSDPSYAGLADGTVEYLDGIDKGGSWTPEDRDRLVDLYDGNLRLADEKTEKIVRSWRSLRPDRELVIIVLSDHGEAFGEHGRFLHNSTLYREMLQVPLIVHPAAWAKDLPPRNKLLSLADVMPMVLRIQEAELPAQGDWPRYFLDVYRGRATGRSQVLLRTSGHFHFGLRTPDILAIQGDGNDREFYWLPDDPTQSRNQYLNDPLACTQLTRTARDLIEYGLATRQPAPLADIDPATKERLKSLGY